VFQNAFQVWRRIPQGLKPAFLLAYGGTAEAVPYPKPIFETRSKESAARVRAVTGVIEIAIHTARVA
jgi:hypothetical protein